MIKIKRFVGRTQAQAEGVSSDDLDRDSVRSLAEAARREYNYALSVLYYEKMIQIWGDLADDWLSVVVMQTEMGRFEEAETSALAALALYPEDFRFHVALGDLSALRGRYRAAAEHYGHGARLDPGGSIAQGKLRDLEQMVEGRERREAADAAEVIAKKEELDLVAREPARAILNPALFQPTRIEATHHHEPALVITFLGIHQRTRWGAGPVVRGVGSVRGFVRSPIPHHAVHIYVDGRLVHSGRLTVGPVHDERTNDRLKKYAFNAWIDFTQLEYGWHDVIIRVVGLDGRVAEGVTWKKESIIVDAPLPAGFFEEATARIPELDPRSDLSLEAQVRALPSVVAEASPNSYPGPIRNVAFFRLDGLGDAAVSVPFVQKLRALLPEAKLVVIASTDNADGCRALDLFDEVIELDFPESPYKQGRFLTQEQQLSLVDRLAAYKFDLAITGMVSDGPRQLSVMAGAPVTIGFGGDDPKSLNIYYDTRDPKSGGNMLNYAARYGMLAKALEVWLDSGAREQRRTDLSRDLLLPYGIGENDRYVLMHTGSRIKATEWPGYAALAQRIVTETNMKVVYIANDATQRETLPEPALADGSIIFLTGIVPFDDFDALISYSSVFIGNDSGPGHLATLRGAKAIRLISARLGGSEWKSEMSGVCIYRRMPCAGCGSIPISKYEECTYDVACIKDITVDEVFEQVCRLSSPGRPVSVGVDDSVCEAPEGRA